VAAYAFIWVAAIVYLFSIWRRLNKVETEMHALARKMPHR
jgi:CcmD family protein